MPKASPTKSTPARNSKPYRPPYYRPGDHIRGKRVYLADTYWLGHSEWEYLGEIIQVSINQIKTFQAQRGGGQ
jgi:hypothetical protein